MWLEETEKLAHNIAWLIAMRNWTPRYLTNDPVVWRSRELNKEADMLANYALDLQKSLFYARPYFFEHFVPIDELNIQTWSDGALPRS